MGLILGASKLGDLSFILKKNPKSKVHPQAQLPQGSSLLRQRESVTNPQATTLLGEKKSLDSPKNMLSVVIDKFVFLIWF